MSEILLDRVILRDTGDMDLAVIVRVTAAEPAPTSAAIRLSARAVDESRSFAATVADAGAGAGEWSITCSIPAGDTDGSFSSEADILDCFVEVTFGREVVAKRLGWGDAGQTWLPYPTASRKLSLTKVKG